MGIEPINIDVVFRHTRPGRLERSQRIRFRRARSRRPNSTPFRLHLGHPKNRLLYTFCAPRAPNVPTPFLFVFHPCSLPFARLYPQNVSRTAPSNHYPVVFLLSVRLLLSSRLSTSFAFARSSSTSLALFSTPCSLSLPTPPTDWPRLGLDLSQLVKPSHRLSPT
jgi:hypothetical protein